MSGKVFWKRGLMVLVSLLVVLAMTAAPTFADSAPPLPTGITLNQSTLNLAVGATATLTATITQNFLMPDANWVSSNPSVATVSPPLGVTAVVTATGPGSASITAITMNGIATTCTVTVTGTPVKVLVTSVNGVTGVTLNKTSDTIAVGATDQLTATVQPATATNQAVTWASSTPSVATVSSSGLVTGVAAGTANITVTTADGGYTATCAVTVNAIKAQSNEQLVVSAPATAVAGTPFSFTVTAEQNNTAMTGYTGTLSFTSTDPAAALPANTALTNGAGAFSATLNTTGSQTITATDASNPAITATASVTVSAAGAGNGIQVYFNKSPLQLDVAPQIVNGRTLVPLRSIFEALGATVQWNAADQSITATEGSTTINLQIGSTTATNNGAQVTLDAAPEIFAGRTLVPARFVSEALGDLVSWDAADQRVNIFTVPGWISSGLKQPSTSKAYDAAFIGRDLLLATPLDPGVQQMINQNNVPSTKDFSQYITFTRNQDDWGGCVGCSMTHLMDIQNQMECPYTPDVSDWYVRARQSELANGGPVNTKNLLENYGDCPEAYLPTDFDYATIDSNGNIDWSTMPQPTAANDQEAVYYKVALLSDPITVDENTMKHLMMQYGPILIEGNIPNVANPHCMTVIGWDDNYNGADGVGAFELLNSWGDHWDINQDGKGNGTYWLTYSDLAAGASGMDNRYIKHGTVDRTGTKYAYSARISLLGGPQALRNGLTVSIAAAGQTPWVFWDRPNHLYENCYDNSENLCIDIPLPDYAAANWLPSAWTIQVTNHSSGASTLQEFTVAHQYNNAGTLAVDTFSSNQTGAIIQGGTTASFTVDVTTAPWVTGVTITPDILNLNKLGTTFTLTATVAPDNACNKAVTWKSSNTGVATVDPNSGLVTAIAPGSATITATTVGTASSGHTCADTISVNVWSLITSQPGQAGQGKIKNKAP